MALITNATVYTYKGITFNRLIAGGGDFDDWISASVGYTKDPVLGGAQAYVDIGGYVFPPFKVRAWFASSADRISMKNLLASAATAGTLSNNRGRSGSCVLVAADEVQIDTPGAYLLDLTFEKVG